VSKPKRNVPIAANSAIPKVYQRPIVELLSKTTTIVKDLKKRKPGLEEEKQQEE